MDDVEEVLTLEYAQRVAEHSAETGDDGTHTEPSEPKAAYCPIVDEWPVGSFGMHSGSLVKARTAVVLITARGDYVAYTDNPPTMRELVRKRARFVSEVDMGHHRVRIRGTVPSAGDAFGFRIVLDLHWRVSDPVRVVRDGVRDVRATLEPLVLARVRPVTRQFLAEQSADAETKVNEVLGTMPEAIRFGFQADAFAQLEMDDEVRERIRLDGKVATYRQIIAAGDLNQFALRLAANPADVAAVVHALIEERDRHRHDTVEFITKLIESDAIERWQVDDQIRAVLQWLQDGNNRVITGTDETRRASLGADFVVDQPTTTVPTVPAPDLDGRAATSPA